MVFKKLNKHDTINWVWFNIRVGQQNRCGQFARCGFNGFLGCGISRGSCISGLVIFGTVVGLIKLRFACAYDGADCFVVGGRHIQFVAQF